MQCDSFFVTQGRRIICVVVIPSFISVVYLLIYIHVSKLVVGEIHREENIDSTLVLPSLNRNNTFRPSVISLVVGEIHRSEDVFLLSFSPL